MIGFGDGSSFALGADGGPIYSSDRFDTSFSTGSFSLHGDAGGSGLPVNTTVLIIAAFVGGAILCKLLFSR